MKYEYIFPKKNYQAKKIAFVRVFYDNGDYFTLAENEVTDISVTFYDRLIWSGHGYSPVVKSGYIRLRAKNTEPPHESSFLYDSEEYKKHRKAYIEDCCVNREGMKCIQLFNKNNWHDTLYGRTVSRMDGDDLVIEFVEQPHFGSGDGKHHSVYIHDIEKSMVRSILLDFENCEMVTVYQDEILDIQLSFDRSLVWGSSNLKRKISGGYLLLRLDAEQKYRYVNHWFTVCSKNSVKGIRTRLCGKKGFSEHDLCHLYIEYGYAGYDEAREECLSIGSIYSYEEEKRREEVSEWPPFIGGYAESRKDGTILIAFGKDAQETIANFG